MRVVIAHSAFLALCASAACLPLLEKPSAGAAVAFTGWPSTYDGRPIRELPLSEGERTFNAHFPGRVGKFTDGRRDLILRYVTRATRQLHSSADCFRGLGYHTTPRPALRDASGAQWSCFLATRESRSVIVSERITDQAGHEWTDVSAWFWSVMLRKSEGPWMAVTVIEDAD